jgi:hypothetical protein
VFGPVTTLQNVAVISSMQITPVTGGDVGEGPFWPDDCCPVEFCNCDCPAALSDWTLDGITLRGGRRHRDDERRDQYKLLQFRHRIRRRRNQHCA